MSGSAARAWPGVCFPGPEITVVPHMPKPTGGWGARDEARAYVSQEMIKTWLAAHSLLLWPPQSSTSPNATSLSVAVEAPSVAVNVAVRVADTFSVVLQLPSPAAKVVAVSRLSFAGAFTDTFTCAPAFAPVPQTLVAASR